ncbi:hypothetical protein GJ496_005043 [Pomphorhynchus laevis]|nr:hypothetical protein GJ496_005043 [Pomphorhynchus laevis]
MDQILKGENLNMTYVYVYNITVCDNNQAEHDETLKRFLDVVQRYRLSLSRDKCHYSVISVKLLGYLIEDGVIKPDPVRYECILKIPPPRNIGSKEV